MMIFPQPQWMEIKEGEYRVDAAWAEKSLTALYAAIKGGMPGVCVASAPMLHKEEYHITVDGEGVTISVACDEGLFRAATTLQQMLRQTQGVLPFAEIKDEPALPRRGYMIDISRGKKPRVETIKMMIDFLAALKYNEFQLYMEGDCFKYAAYPKETADFDCLTPDDIVELDAYCKERFIDLVPNQNSFGHMYTCTSPCCPISPRSTSTSAWMKPMAWAVTRLRSTASRRAKMWSSWSG